jgi:hypothetical protein
MRVALAVVSELALLAAFGQPRKPRFEGLAP